MALGDYAAGPSHVLPTSGTARFASGLSANDFLRANSILHFSQRRHDAPGPRRASAGHQGRPDRTSGERGSEDEGGRLEWTKTARRHLSAVTRHSPLSTIHISSAMSYFRPEIEAMAGYVPGEQPQDGEFIKLNTNENPYPPSPAVARAIEEAAAARAAKVSRPDGRARFAAGRPNCWASSPTGSSAATAATTS